MSLGRIPKTTCGCGRKPFLCSPIRTPVNIPFLFFFLISICYFIYYLSSPPYLLTLLLFVRSFVFLKQVSFLMRSQTYLIEQWESSEEIKFNYRAKINTKVFCLSVVLREGSFLFRAGYFGVFKKRWVLLDPTFGRTPKTPTVEKTPPPPKDTRRITILLIYTYAAILPFCTGTHLTAHLSVVQSFQ